MFYYLALNWPSIGQAPRRPFDLTDFRRKLWSNLFTGPHIPIQDFRATDRACTSITINGGRTATTTLKELSVFGEIDSNNCLSMTDAHSALVVIVLSLIDMYD